MIPLFRIPSVFKSQRHGPLFTHSLKNGLPAIVVTGILLQSLLVQGQTTGQTSDQNRVLTDVSNQYFKPTNQLHWVDNVTQGVLSWYDYNGDKSPDLLVTGLLANGSRGGNLYANYGEFQHLRGGFVPTFSPVTNGAADWGDYNHDGWTDLMIIGNDNHGPVSRLFHNGGGPNGFDDRSGILPNLPGLSDGSVAFGDYDHDDNLDLIVTGRDANGTPVTKLYHNKGGNNGFTEDPARIPNLPALGNSKATWADYDHDTKLDLMLTGKQADGTFVCRLYHNTGTDFEDKTNLLKGLPGLANASITWVDYDKNGNLDLLLTGDTGSAHVNKLYYNLGGISGFEDRSDRLRGLPGLSETTASFGDYDHDGLPDLLIAGRTFFNQWLTWIAHNSGDGFDFSPLTETLSQVQVNDVAATWVDFDQDSWVDVSMTGTTPSGPATKLYRNTAVDVSGQLPELPDLPALSNSTVAWADYDNDGKLDLLVTGLISDGIQSISRLYHNTGNGLEDETTSLLRDLPGLSNSAMAWGDYDNDSRLDLMITGSQDGSANKCFSALYHNTGNGFELKNNLLPGLSPVWNGSLAWTDYNNDGKLDLLMTGQAQDKSLVSKLYRNTGSGFDDQTNQLPDLEGMWLTQAAFGDYDNDGRPDLFIAGLTKFNFVSMLYHNTGNGFQAENDQLPGLPKLSAGAVAWGDYDNDGWQDLFISGEQETEDPKAPRYTNVLYRNTGNGVVKNTAASTGLSRRASGSAAWGDFDNDGKLDLMTVGSDLGSPSGFYHNTGNGFEPVASVLPGELSEGSAAFGDYDNDGRLDIMLTGNGFGGYVSQLYHNTTPVANTPPTVPVGLNSQVLGGGTSVKLSWQPATDAQTPSAGLNYNLYVSDTPGGQNVAAPMADLKSGYRRVVQLGNSQPTSHTLTGLTLGNTYYWSVQAIDGAFAGSAFAPEQSLTTSPLGEPEQALTLIAPLYNCQTGAFTFQTTGGDGTLIAFRAPGITAWTNNPRQYVDTGLRKAADAQPITLVARQSGKEVRSVFDLRAVCPVGDPNQFRLVAPLYDCETGGFSFRTQGGGDSPIEYMAAGITSWTSDPFQIVDSEVQQAADAQPITLVARQSGNEVRYVWDIRAICPVEAPGLGLGSPQSQNFQDVSDLLQDLPAVEAPSLAWSDYDNDGLLDFFVTGKADTPISRLYRNTGNGFENKSNLMPSDMPQVSNSAIAWADYDNDGKLDLLLTGLTAANTSVSKLYHNTGSGFEDKTSLIQGQPQVGNGAIAWGDYDNDGRVDFILTGRSAFGAFSKLYHNEGNSFEEAIPSQIPGLPQVQLSAVDWADYDNDGRLDLMLTGLAQSNTAPYVSKLYRNTGNGFADVSSDQLPGLVGLVAGTIVWNDFDNDGNLDLLLTGTNGGTTYTTRLYRNTDYGFEDASRFAGFYSGSAAFGDYDNDGLKDLIITGVTTAGRSSRLYRNTGRGFADASDQLPNLPQVSNSAIAWADYDNDGKLDLLMMGRTASGNVLKLYHNSSPVANTPPSIPSRLMMDQISTNTVVLSWDRSTDAQTPRDGLHYNLYVADTPNLVNKVSPMADPTTGFRQVVQLGNSQPTSYTLTGLLPGVNYYWSVQAIDGAFAGSPFASQQRFKLSEAARIGVGQEPGMGLRAEVYPNPVNSELTVQIEGAQNQPVKLNLMNLSGQTVLERKLDTVPSAHQERLPVDGLPSGLYLLRVSTSQQNVTLKIIKR